MGVLDDDSELDELDEGDEEDSEAEEAESSDSDSEFRSVGSDADLHHDDSVAAERVSGAGEGVAQAPRKKLIALGEQRALKSAEEAIEHVDQELLRMKLVQARQKERKLEEVKKRHRKKEHLRGMPKRKPVHTELSTVMINIEAAILAKAEREISFFFREDEILTRIIEEYNMPEPRARKLLKKAIRIFEDRAVNRVKNRVDMEREKAVNRHHEYVKMAMEKGDLSAVSRFERNIMDLEGIKAPEVTERTVTVNVYDEHKKALSKFSDLLGVSAEIIDVPQVAPKKLLTIKQNAGSESDGDDD